MNLSLFFLCFCAFSNVCLANENEYIKTPLLRGIPEIIDGIIKGVLEKMRVLIPEPLSIPQLNISLPFENIANGTYGISDLIESGIGVYNISTIQTNILKSSINFVICIPVININGVFYQDMLFGSLVPFYGQGPFNIHLKNLTFTLDAKYSLNILKLQMLLKNTSFVTTLEDATFDLHGVIDNESFSIIMSQILDDTVSSFINKHTKLISNIVSPIIETVFNSIMKKKVSKPTELLDENFDIYEKLNYDDLKVLANLFTQVVKENPKLRKVSIV